MNRNKIFIGVYSSIVLFASLARGGHDLWAATAVTLAATLTLVTFLTLTREFRWPMAPWLFLTLGVGLLLSFLGASNKSEAWMSLKDILTSLLLFLLAANIFRNENDWAFFAAFFVPGFWILAVFALAGLPRPLINPNLEAAFLLLWFPVLLDRYLSSLGAGSGTQWYWLSGLLGAGITFAGTGSVSAWAVLILVLVAWSRQMGVRWKLLLVIAGVVGLGLLLFKWETTSSVANRLAWWRTAVNMFLAHPWTGVGLGNYPSAFLAYRVPSGENTLSAHSWFFQILAEMGLVGLIAFLGVIAYLIKMFSRFQDRSNLQKSFALGAVATSVYCLANVGGEYFFLRILVPMFFVGLLSPVLVSARPRMSVVFLSAGIFVLSIPFVVAPFLASRHQVTGQIYLSQADVEQAEKSFRIAAHIDPWNWESRAALARIAYDRSLFQQDTSFYDEAISLQKEAIRLNGLNGRLWWDLGRYTASRGAASTDSEKYFQKARDLGFISSSSIS